MAKLIAILNQISDAWFGIIALNSLHLVILFALLFGINMLFRKKSSVFLYSIWTLFLLKAILLPVIRLPFLQRSVIPVIPLNAIVANSTQILSSPETGAAGTVTIQSILLLLWTAGITTLLIMYVRNEHLFFSSLKNSKPFPAQNKLQQLAVQLGIRKPVELRLSPNVPAPFTKGFRKPVIYLPQSALNWNENQLNHVLCHELAHIQRKDILVITFQNIINVLYFFHPLVWTANHHLNFQREKICDDTAINILNENPARYGRTLMDNLESFLVHRRLPLIANGLFFSKKTIIKRFEYLLNRGKEIEMKLSTLQKGLIAGLVLIVVILSCNNQSNDGTISSVEKSISETALVEMTADEKAKFIPYDTPPEPIGGFAAIQKNVIYPEADKEAGNEGTVVVQAFLDENGDVTEAVILKSPGLEGLDNAAINAIKQTKFKPAMQEETPVGVYISIPVVFKLDKDNDIK